MSRWKSIKQSSGGVAVVIKAAAAGTRVDSTSPGAEPVLIWRDARGNERSLELTSTAIKVGRAQDCAIRTDDVTVSRHHARIFRRSGGYMVEDLSSGSGVGVHVRGQRVRSHVLDYGDVIQCGSLWPRPIRS